MKYRIQHITRYLYEKDVDFGPHTVRLRPAVHAKSKVDSYSLSIKPDCQVRWQYDPWNNLIARLVFPADEKFRELSICVDANIETKPVNPFDFYVESWCENLPFDYPDLVKKELAPFLEPPEVGPLLKVFLKNFPLEGTLVDYLVNLNSTVCKTIEYVQREEAGIQNSEETLKKKSGSCRDTALLVMDILRASGLAARFVSGYLIQEVVSSEDENQKSLSLALHAWTEIYIPGAGWIGLDATSGLLSGEGHIPLACTVTAEQAAPVTGTASDVAREFKVESSVAVVGDELSPEIPYTDDTMKEIVRVGDTIDSMLESYGITLTSGGEPTFTASDLCDKPEWFTQALGETKWSRATKLFRKLFDRFGEGPLPVVGTGKIYPGEADPRWAMTLMWRVDGEPVWLNEDLLFWPSGKHVDLDTEKNDRAKEFLEVLAENLGVQSNIIPGFEDPVEFVIAEENLPCEEDLSDITAYMNLDDDDERKRLARIIDKGVGNTIGFALPLTKLEGKWFSNDWKFKREKMYLIPGKSPMGLRLPLERINSEIESDFARDPSIATEDLPKRSKESHEGGRGVSGNGGEQPESSKDDNSQSPVTALCVQAYPEALGVFLPPLVALDDYLELIEGIEETAATIGVKVLIEGYGPPPDSRIKSISLTPDPGVLEVNMPVCDSLRQYSRALELVSDAALECKLGVEKYQLDGRIVGTGGGHHITLGGPTTLESPFITHPHILASMIRYFQNHPSLSFFFTGLFVGPHSQAPRIDEARLESLYELELALAQFPSPGDDSPPWLTDRLLRNILVDMTGNTHRAEICIDKLYNPESQTGRLGLVELRAFEMPPHQHMAVVQILLIRALIARFMIEPYKEKLITWSEALHDKFMLPHYLWNDLGDIIFDLNSHDLKLKREWFKPFMEFRFPVFGRMIKNDIQLELRCAHEPWHILSVFNEETTTTSRPVDSSMERIQVKVTNLNINRHKVIVNGVEIPLTEIGVSGEYIGAVRFRAWQPPNCMHPNIEVHHPLKFELVDIWTKRSLGACQYHVVHPEGKIYEELPLTRHDAEARMTRRFTEGNHTPWPVEFTACEPTGAVTLDLRLFSTEENLVT